MLTDARFSGVSTGACIGHVGPEALAGGPIGRVRDGDLIRIVVDRVRPGGQRRPRRRGRRASRPEQAGPHRWPSATCTRRLSPDPELPDDTRLWAALQAVGGGTWGGCVYDVEAIVAVLEAGLEARARTREAPAP